MAQPGALDNAGIRELYDEQNSYYPNDTNIAKGLVVCFDSTSGDNRSVVLPSHASVLLGGRAFAGISVEEGSPATSGQDKAWTVQQRGTADCMLKNSTACTRGQIAGYLPSDAGRVVPYTGASMVAIGRFLQTKAAGTDVMVGVKLGDTGARSTDLLNAIVASSTAIGTDAETLLDTTYTVPANQLQVNDVVHIVGKARYTVGASGDKNVLILYFGGLLGLVLCSSATGGGGTDVAQHDIWMFDIWVTIRSATTCDVFGIQTVVPAATGVAIPLAIGLQAPQTIPTITGTNVIGVSSNWNAASTDRVQLESLIVMHHPQTA